MAAHAAARPLALVLKALLARHGRNEVYTGGMGSYAALVLVLAAVKTYSRRSNQPAASPEAPLPLGPMLLDLLQLMSPTPPERSGHCLVADARGAGAIHWRQRWYGDDDEDDEYSYSRYPPQQQQIVLVDPRASHEPAGTTGGLLAKSFNFRDIQREMAAARQRLLRAEGERGAAPAAGGGRLALLASVLPVQQAEARLRATGVF